TAFVHPEDRSRLRAVLENAIAGRARFDIQHRIVLRDGCEKVVHGLGAVKRGTDGKPTVLSGTVHDITDRVRIEAERERRYRAEEADRIKSAFLATMSHELRTPLNSIIGFTGVLLQGLAGPLNSEQNKQLDMVRASARHLLALVNDVLDISKIEAGQLEVSWEPYDVHRSLEKVIHLIKPQAQTKQLEMRADLPTSLGRLVGDVRRFEQVLLNLLSNAIKFTERGSIELRAERIEKFRMRGSTVDTAVVRVKVSDTGVGIKPEDLPVLFQPFRQLDSGLARKHEGTGLGLAICARLVDLMGGEINVQSTWSEGSTFEVILPLDARANA
ncbi:MAG TPA: ATP-binding protein, partial [Steroidobacteraceae bacterium]|nr:ATP-binding protein [Steroidobacteraceae bacterium]